MQDNVDALHRLPGGKVEARLRVGRAFLAGGGGCNLLFEALFCSAGEATIIQSSHRLGVLASETLAFSPNLDSQIAHLGDVRLGHRIYGRSLLMYKHITKLE